MLEHPKDSGTATGMAIHTRPFFIVTAIAALSGCATSNVDYPTLEIRDFERSSGTFAVPEIPDAPSTPLAPAQLSRIADLESQASAAHQAFLNAAPSARRAVSRGAGAAPGSNASGDALVALADLDAKRSLTAIVLADLDLLHAEQATALNGQTEVDAARSTVTQMLRDQDSVLRELRSSR